MAGAPTRWAVMPGWLRLMRPANVMTAYADILAGVAAAGVGFEPQRVLLLLAATTGLYGGGIVMNDVFDAELDAVERPERPIPSGAISRKNAGLFGGCLLTGGVGVAFLCSPLSGGVALLTAMAVLLYDSWGKAQSVLGPLNMGLCRGLNLLLGTTVAGVWAGRERVAVGLVTLCYIAGITALSRGEVKGGTRAAAQISLGWLVAGAVVLGAAASQATGGLIFAVPILVALLIRIGPPFRAAFGTLEPLKIRSAIKAGILSLILLDAAIAALYGGWRLAVGVLLLYIPSILLARFFAVT